jgi:hypothetical protein
VNQGSDYIITLYNNRELIGSISIPLGILTDPDLLYSIELALPESLYTKGYNRLHLMPVNGIGPFCLGYFKSRN